MFLKNILTSLYLVEGLAWCDWPFTWWTDQLFSFSAWHCWLGHLTRKIVPVIGGTLNRTGYWRLSELWSAGRVTGSRSDSVDCCWQRQLSEWCRRDSLSQRHCQSQWWRRAFVECVSSTTGSVWEEHDRPSGLSAGLFLCVFRDETGKCLEGHNSVDRLTIYDYRRECKGTATLDQHGSWTWLFQYPSSNSDTLCDPVNLTFDLIFIGGRGIVMDYPCAKFSDFSFSRFGFIVPTESHTEWQRRMIALLTRLPRRE